MRLKLFNFIVFLLIVSCSKYKEGEVIDGEDVVPPSPPFWEYFTIKGYDVDQDGVRDDIEIWVNENIDDPNLRRILKIEAFIWQRFMFVRNVREAKDIVDQDLFKADSCHSFLIGYLPPLVREKIPRGVELVFNNFWRRNYEKAASKYVPTGDYSPGERNMLLSFRTCPFTVNNLKFLLEAYYQNGIYKNNSTEDEKQEYLKLLKETK